MIEFQLAESGTTVPTGWTTECKMDGTRIVATKEGNKVKLTNRHGVEKVAQYPEIETAIKKFSFDCVLDGEIIANDFFQLMRREKTTEPLKMRILQKTVPVQYQIFDLLSIDGRDIRNLPQCERKRILEQNIHENKTIKIVRAEPLEILKQKMERDEIEGFIAKNPDAPYVGRRTKDWLKFKREKNEDAWIIGYTQTDKSNRQFRALIIKLPDGSEHHLASGLTQVLISKLYNEMSALPYRETKDGHYLEQPFARVEISYYPDVTTKYRFPKFLRMKD